MNRGRRLSRTSSHRKAMYRNMIAALFTHGRIITTPAKAKEARPFAERLITLAKKGADDLAARRRAIRLLHDPALVRSLFEDLGVRYKDRNGGYTRILHLSRTRIGDSARQVLFELVEGGVPAGKTKAEKPRAAVVKDEPAKQEKQEAEAPAEESSPVDPAVEGKTGE
jgi:large subunit ribosomal protein L17